jgi:undecaprenyl phosphate-alpha-L-ara4N flippase subunit ArnE
MSKSTNMDDPLRPDKRTGVPLAERPAPPPDNLAARRPVHEEASRGRHLTIASIALLLFSVCSAATGQLLLKHGMQIASARAAKSGGSLVVSAATSPWILFGLAVFAVSAVAWLAVLSRVPLSVAYPFNAMGYLVILTASILVLHERANVLTWAGSFLVVSGLVIVALARP